MKYKIIADVSAQNITSPLAQDNTVFAKFPPQAWFSLGNPRKKPIVKDLVLTTFPNLRLRKDFCFYSGVLSQKYRKEAVCT